MIGDDAVGEAELAERFHLREEVFEHGGFVARMLLPLSSDELIDVSDFNTDERLPYWAELWPSARALTREILECERLPTTGIELGSGVALPSIAAASRGVDVVATDYYEEALMFSQVNARRNGIRGLRVRELDWRDATSDLQPAQLVIAADVLYEARNIAPVSAAIERFTRPGGEAWIADPRRSYFGDFLERMDLLGWSEVKRVERKERAVGDLTTLVTIAHLKRLQDLPPFPPEMVDEVHERNAAH